MWWWSLNEPKSSSHPDTFLFCFLPNTTLCSVLCLSCNFCCDKGLWGKKSGLPLANISIIVIISKISEVVLFSSRMLCNQITRFSLTKIPKSLYLTQLTDYHSSCWQVCSWTDTELLVLVHHQSLPSLNVGGVYELTGFCKQNTFIYDPETKLYFWNNTDIKGLKFQYQYIIW